MRGLELGLALVGTRPNLVLVVVRRQAADGFEAAPGPKRGVEGGEAPNVGRAIAQVDGVKRRVAQLPPDGLGGAFKHLSLIHI
eukprot:12876363-Alexandrium_andersonii.AAC.1